MLCASWGQNHKLPRPVSWPPLGLRRVNGLNGTAPPGWSQPRERSSKTISCLWALAKPTVTTPWSEAASGLDYTKAGDAAFSCLCPLASNSTGHLGPNWAAVGKGSASNRAAARAVLKEVPTWTKLPLAQLPTTCSFLHSNGRYLLSTRHCTK